MAQEFWHERWETDHIPFHLDHVNPQLEQFYQQTLSDRHRIFVPLCGKSVDMFYLYERGHDVTGIELSEKAVKAFFEQHSLSYEITDQGDYRCYQTERLRLYAGDFFNFHEVCPEQFDAIYDRAALVALPEKLRQRYVATMSQYSQAGTTILLVTLDYDQSLYEGPPYAVSDAEVRQTYGTQFNIECLNEVEAENVPEDLRGGVIQRTYRLQNVTR